MERRSFLRNLAFTGATAQVALGQQNGSSATVTARPPRIPRVTNPGNYGAKCCIGNSEALEKPSRLSAWWLAHRQTFA